MTLFGRMRDSRFVSELTDGLRDEAARFPVPFAAVLLSCWHANSAVHSGLWRSYRAIDVHLGLASAVFLSLAVTAAGESRGWSRSTTQAAALGGGLLAFGLIWFDRPIGTLSWAVPAMSFGAVFLAPFIFRGSALEFWSYGRRLVLELVLAGLVFAATTVGVVVIVKALEFLFDLDVPNDTYVHIWATSLTLVAPLFALARFPRRFDELPEDMLADTLLYSALRAVADFVMAPVFLALALILHLYAAKILAGDMLPKGQIGWIVVAFGTGMVVLLLAFAPFRPVARAPLRFFLHFWPLMLPVPLVLLALAVEQRIGQYGMTPERYLLIALGAVLAVVALLQIPARTRGDARWLAAIPLLALLISSAGPWGAVHVSVADQAMRFGALIGTPDRSLKQEAEAKNLLRFLADYGALERVAPEGTAIGDAGDRRAPYAALARVEKAFGLTTRRISRPDRPDLFEVNLGRVEVFDPAGYDMIAPDGGLFKDRHWKIGLSEGGMLDVALDGLGIAVTVGEKTRRFAIPADVFEAAVRAKGNSAAVIDVEAEGCKARLIVTRASGRLSPELEIDSLQLSLLLRRADWP